MPEPAKKSLVAFTYVVLVLSTLLVFWQTGNFAFAGYDDNDYVYDNLHVSSGLSHDGIIWAFTTGHASNWHPVTWLSHMLDCQLFGPKPGWMHLVNVLLHLASTLLLFAVLRKMTGALWQSTFVAAAFALHPMHVESVAWIAERKDVLSTFFLLLTLAAYASYVKRPSAFRYVASLVLFALGLMAKPMLVTLPFLLLLLDYWPLNRFNTQSRYRIIAEKIPFFVLAAASSLVTILVQRAGGAVADVALLPLPSRAANAFLSYAKYVGRMFWPQDLAVYYPLEAESIVLWQAAMSALLLLVVSILVIRFGRNHRYLPVGWFWFVGMLVPVIGFVQVGGQAFADRYTYIPYIGLFIMVAWGLPELLPKWPQQKLALGISAAAALTALGICAHKQVGYWSNGIALFSHTIEVTQNNAVAYNNRSAAYYDLGRWQEVIEDCREAIRIRPDYVEAYNNRGVAYRELGRNAEAIADLSQAIKLKPNYLDAYYNRGLVYGKLGRGAEAIEDLTAAIMVQPAYAEAYNNRGVAYGGLGRYHEALEDFKEAIRIRPTYVEAYNNRGLAYNGLGLHQDAIDAYRQAIDIKPDFADAHYNLAVELAAQGQFDEATGQYHAALRLKPDWPLCMNNLAYLIATNAQLKDRDTNEAIRLARGACELSNSKNPFFLDTLAAAYASAGRFTEAVDTANKALSMADADNQPQLKSIIQQHLSLYQQGKPCIEPPSKRLTDPDKL